MKLPAASTSFARAFLAAGYARGEGCGSVVLQLAAAAAAAGNTQVLGYVRGTALNQDGRSSSLTAPNGPSQQAVIAAALAEAGVAAADVDYVLRKRMLAS